MKTIVLMLAAALAVSSAAMADAYKFDAKGKCHDDHGKFAKQELCKPMAMMGPAHMYKLDAKKKCRDEKGHFADAKFCHA